MQCKDQMKTQQSLYMTFTDLQALATDSAGQVKMLQQAVHIKELLQVLPRNWKSLLNTFEMQSNLHFIVLVASFISCIRNYMAKMCPRNRSSWTNSSGGLQMQGYCAHAFWLLQQRRYNFTIVAKNWKRCWFCRCCYAVDTSTCAYQKILSKPEFHRLMRFVETESAQCTLQCSTS